ncbi:hypothetical protein CH359_07925 [Leptospira meyeri]|nr:hypothetical protein CH359_07925 [Leptospira meyeri]PJZ96517.1 hypothetical protein CH358_09595 [Leptospira meyeri]
MVVEKLLGNSYVVNNNLISVVTMLSISITDELIKVKGFTLVDPGRGSFKLRKQINVFFNKKQFQQKMD